MTLRFVNESSALVGSSATRRQGSFRIAIAISTRCASPTLICCGNCRRKPSSEGRPTRTSKWRTRSICGSHPWGECARHASRKWVRSLRAGFSEATGLCRISAISLPRKLRISFSEHWKRLRPRNRQEPLTLPPFRCSNPRMARARVLLPEPLSPARPRISPSKISRETSRNTAGRRG